MNHAAGVFTLVTVGPGTALFLFLSIVVKHRNAELDSSGHEALLASQVIWCGHLNSFKLHTHGCPLSPSFCARVPGRQQFHLVMTMTVPTFGLITDGNACSIDWAGVEKQTSENPLEPPPDSETPTVALAVGTREGLGTG